MNNFVADTQDNASCPIVAGTPDVMKAAFTKEGDLFAEMGVPTRAEQVSRELGSSVESASGISSTSRT